MKEKINQYAEEYNFLLGADEDIIGIAIGFGRQLAQSGETEFAEYFLGIAYDLTGDDRIKEFMDSLND